MHDSFPVKPLGVAGRLLFFTFGVLLMAALVSGCGGSERSREPAAQKSMPVKAFAMQGVHPHLGGHAIWAKKNGMMIIQAIDLGIAHGKSGQLWEKRYQLKTRPGVQSEVELIIGSRNFLALKSKKEAGASDDDRVSIMVVPEKGAPVKVSQWGNSRDLGFDQLYEYLRRICREVEGEQKPIHEGVYDPDWRPAGFERPW